MITTDNPEFAKRMRMFRNHGITLDHQQREALKTRGMSPMDDGTAQVPSSATGFIRPQEDGSLEWVMCHNTGFVEIYYGEIHAEQPRFEVATDAVARTAPRSSPGPGSHRPR